MKWVVITKYRHKQQVPEGENWFNFISEIIRPGAYDVDQLFWFKVDDNIIAQLQYIPIEKPSKK